MKNRIAKLWRCFWQSLPLYSKRQVDTQWVAGWQTGGAALGITRDDHGRFIRIK